VVGSSSVNQAFGRIIARELRGRGYRVRRKGVTSAGLARPDYRDMRTIVEELPIGEQTSAVFIYLGDERCAVIVAVPVGTHGAVQTVSPLARRAVELALCAARPRALGTHLPTRGPSSGGHLAGRRARQPPAPAVEAHSCERASRSAPRR
jgi:hypothetical protein